jgi:hypothetical protein
MLQLQISKIDENEQKKGLLSARKTNNQVLSPFDPKKAAVIRSVSSIKDNLKQTSV